ncbi:MAG: radical SAM protein [Candidatus Omnitrophica bacterium]|nr:radical SAM protein [Candidatus Omnitrophota bacterium]
MKNKLKFISIMLVFALLWQPCCWAAPLDFSSLRPVAARERDIGDPHYKRDIRKVVFINITERNPIEARPPLAVAYLSSFIKKNFKDGIDIKVVDMATIPPDFNFGKYMSAEKPDMVCVSVGASSLFPIAAEVTTAVKKALPESITVVGGVHITAQPEEVITYSCFDILAVGEGELTLVNLIKSMSSGTGISRVNGIWFRDMKGGVIKTGKAEVINLDELPVDVFDAIPLEKYNLGMEQFAGQRYLPMMATRGCPFNCRFCTNAWHGRMRFKSPEALIEEIKFNVNKYGIYNFPFQDDTFTANKKWVEKFCDLVIREHLDIRWRCMTRASRIDKDLMTLMHRAGCVYIAFGLESADPTVLKAANKEENLDAYRRVCGWAKDIGIRVKLFVMVGLPLQTVDSIRKTVQFLEEVRPEEVGVAIFVPYPGSEFARELGKWGLHVTEDDWEAYVERPQLGDPSKTIKPVLYTSWMSAAEMVTAKRFIEAQFARIEADGIRHGVRQVPRQGIQRVIERSRGASTIMIKKDTGFCLRRQAYANSEDLLREEIQWMLDLSLKNQRDLFTVGDYSLESGNVYYETSPYDEVHNVEQRFSRLKERLGDSSRSKPKPVSGPKPSLSIANI